MYILFLIAAAGLALNAPSPSPSPVPFGAMATCAQNVRVIPEIFQAMTSDTARRAIDHARLIDPANWRDILGEDTERQATGAIATCPAGPKRDLLRAYAASWLGYIEWYSDIDRWRDDLNLSDQLFSACVKANSGLLRGAQCATGIETNARWRKAWGS
jgi:hypothetical protein